RDVSMGQIDFKSDKERIKGFGGSSRGLYGKKLPICLEVSLTSGKNNVGVPNKGLVGHLTSSLLYFLNLLSQFTFCRTDSSAPIIQGDPLYACYHFPHIDMNAFHDARNENGYLSGDIGGLRGNKSSTHEVKPHPSLEFEILARNIAFHYNPKRLGSWDVSITIGAFRLAQRLDGDYSTQVERKWKAVCTCVSQMAHRCTILKDFLLGILAEACAPPVGYNMAHACRRSSTFSLFWIFQTFSRSQF
ncbi:hypothetical protein HAX54_051484, partial [Datura stramonium]|nr:hypothetical protein [Datura stramonium]